MSATPTLSYFDIRGNGEIPRLCLAAAGVDFKDDRIDFVIAPPVIQPGPVWFTQLKAQQPFTQVPVLTTETGLKIAQSSAITRYIARRYNIAGATEEENAFLDSGLEQIAELGRAWYAARSDPEKAKKFFEELNTQLGLLEKNIRGTYYNGDKLSYVDVALYYTLYVLESANKEAVTKVLEGNKKSSAIFAAVPKQEKIAAYLDKRPARPF